MNRELNIRLYRRGRSTDETDGYWQVGYDFTLSDFAGVLPGVGDTIVPFVAGVREVTQHKFYVVQERVFRPPGTHNQFVNVALIVTERNGVPEDEHLITGGG